MTPPDWLKTRGGELRSAVDGSSLFVCFNHEPQYELTPLPSQGKHGCRVIQSVNGKPIECGAAFESADAALRGGLEALRNQLGW